MEKNIEFTKQDIINWTEEVKIILRTSNKVVAKRLDAIKLAMEKLK